ncbi:MAG: MGMT family protein [Firmicutes bacterium]|nr:MGMT family protein [Bacillota bacterium]
MENTFQRIYALIGRIPSGRVSTYGQIALFLGNPRMARVVGYALHVAPPELPCHRVVNRFGGLSEAFSPFGRESHRQLLEEEGVGFLENGNVNLSAFLWEGPEAEAEQEG